MQVGLPLDALLPKPPDPTTRKEAGAARDFEALLIGQMLRSSHEEGSGWLGTDNDDAGSAAMGLGEEELAKAIAKGGGFGLAKVIASGLAARRSGSDTDADSTLRSESDTSVRRSAQSGEPGDR